MKQRHFAPLITEFDLAPAGSLELGDPQSGDHGGERNQLDLTAQHRHHLAAYAFGEDDDGFGRVQLAAGIQKGDGRQQQDRTADGSSS